MSSDQVIIEQGIVAGNYSDKYGTRNPIARALMNGFLNSFRQLVRETGAKSVHEVGCGEGELAMILREEMGLQVRGSDFSTQVIDEARIGAQRAGADVDFRVASVYELEPPNDEAELIVCCEVLEHLEEPEHALEVLSRLARPHLLVSVPREPLWRTLNVARGKYLSALGNTPGHVNHWSQRGILRLLRGYVDPVAIRSPLPWTMVLCRTRHSHETGDAPC